MKKILSILFLLLAITFPLFAEGTEAVSTSSLLLDNWVVILFAVLGVVGLIVPLTKTKTDDKYYSIIVRILNSIFPNRGKK